MSRRRRTANAFDIIPPLVALIFVAVLFVPGFRQFLGSLFVVIVIGVSVAFVGLLAWKIYRRNQTSPAASVQPFASRAIQPKPAASSSPPALEVAKRETGSTVRAPAELSLELLRQMEWKRFEDVVAAYVRELGQSCRTTRIGPDGGVDVEVLDPASGAVVLLVQCKAWDAYRVGIKPVRELFGVMAAKRISEGAFFTTGNFTEEALTFGRENQLDLVDGDELIARMKQLSADARSRLITVATEGDYTTPTCPSCGVKMVRRTASKGRSEGQDFWGCRNYPRCRQTFRC